MHPEIYNLRRFIEADDSPIAGVRALAVRAPRPVGPRASAALDGAGDSVNAFPRYRWDEDGVVFAPPRAYPVDPVALMGRNIRAANNSSLLDGCRDEKGPLLFELIVRRQGFHSKKVSARQEGLIWDGFRALAGDVDVWLSGEVRLRVPEVIVCEEELPGRIRHTARRKE